MKWSKIILCFTTCKLEVVSVDFAFVVLLCFPSFALVKQDFHGLD